MPGLVLISPWVADGIRKMVAESCCAFGEPRIGRGLVEPGIERPATDGREVDRSTRVVFAKARGRTDGKNAFKLSANDGGLSLDAAQDGDDEQVGAVGERCRFETAPCFGSRMDEKKVLAVRPGFNDFQRRGFCMFVQTASCDQFAGNSERGEVRVHAEGGAWRTRLPARRLPHVRWVPGTVLLQNARATRLSNSSGAARSKAPILDSFLPPGYTNVTPRLKSRILNRRLWFSGR